MAPDRYEQAGVNAADADRFAANLARRFPGLGGFSGLFPLGDATRGLREPMLAASADGVGTKALVARAVGDCSTIGVDCVAMVANDLLCVGAKPLFFLDYLAAGKFDRAQSDAIVDGVAKGCAEAGFALLGGETAELPGMLRAGDFDLAGFGVGVVERAKALDGATIVPGDAIVGLASSGVHANGLSLARAIFPEFAHDAALARELLVPTRIYVQPALKLLQSGARVKGIAHVTGGGLPRNLARVLPTGVGAAIDPANWPRPPIFDRIQKEGAVERADMFRVFNMGVGLCLAAPREEASGVVDALRREGCEAWPIGEATDSGVVAIKGAS